MPTRLRIKAGLLVASVLCPFVASMITARPAGAQAPTAKLTLSTSAVRVGDAAVLTWVTTGATQVFVSGVGTSPPSGSSRVNPQASTHFLLVAEGPGGVTTAEADLDVLGAKGGGDYPDESSFRYPLSFPVHAPSCTSLIERIQAILQDSLRHSVSLRQVADRILRFVTNRREGTDLVGPAETRIADRRLAYLVEVPCPHTNTHQFTFTIQSTIEYRRRIERVWRPETSDSMYDVQGHKLAQIIRAGS